MDVEIYCIFGQTGNMRRFTSGSLDLEASCCLLGRLGLENINSLFISVFIFGNYLAFCQVSLFQAVDDAVERDQMSEFELMAALL